MNALALVVLLVAAPAAEDMPAAGDMLSATLTVRESGGQPASGVEFSPRAFGGQRRAMSYWRPDITGRPESFTSDERGEVYFIVGPAARLANVTRLYGTIVSREGGRKFGVSLRRDDDGAGFVGEFVIGPPKVPGRRVWVTPEPLDGPVDDDAYAVAAGSTAPLVMSEGRLAVPPKYGRGSFPLLLAGGPKGRKQFSDPFLLPPIAEGEQQEATLKTPVFLQSGVELRGRLDDAVPRPTSGFVLANAAFEGVKFHGIHHSPFVTRRARVEADGTFVIRDIPRGCYVEVFAAAGSRVSKPLNAEERATLVEAIDVPEPNQHHFDPLVIHAFTVPAADVGEEIVVPTTATASAEVTVRYANGSPASNVEVAIDSRIGSFAQGSDNFVLHHPDEFRLGIEALPPHRRWSAVTNDRGVAVITGLPPGRSQDPSITPLTGNPAGLSCPLSGNRVVSTTLVSGETARVTFTVDRLP